MALKNANGGVLIIGIKDDGKPAKQPHGYDVNTLFNPDSVQAIVHEYAAEKFEIELYIVDEDAASAVVIVVPGGLTTPVVCRKSFEHKRVKLQEGVIYTRTYRSNNIVSSAPAQQNDIAEIVKKCHENRVAEIGEFLRRHLTDENVEVLARRIEPMRPPAPLSTFAHGSWQHLQHLLRGDSGNNKLGWFEVTFQVPCTPTNLVPNRRWLESLLRKNPGLTGWPLFVDLWNARDESFKPRMATQDIWECQMFADDMKDYWRIDGKQGLFYAARTYWDDTSPNSPAPGKILDFSYQIRNVAESIFIAGVFANYLCDKDTDPNRPVGIYFRWTHLDKRRLSSWARPERMLHDSHYNPAVNMAKAAIEIPMAMSNDEVAIFTHEAVNELFRCFDGWEAPQVTVTDIVSQLTQRKW